MASDHFGFTKLVVGDLEKSAAFYKTVCGLTEQGRVEAEIGGRRISEIMFNATAPGGGTFVLLSFLDTPNPAAGEMIVGFITPDVNGFVERARSAGGSVLQQVVSQPEHGVKVAFLKDVEGHLIEVVELLK